MDGKHYLGGAISGIFEISVTHPIDVLKIRTQSGLKWPNSTKKFYRGYFPRLIGVIPMRLSYWGVQGTVDNFYDKNAVWWKRGGVIGAWTGSAQTLLDCPIENRKTYLITADEVGRSKDRKLIEYRGFVPNLYRNVIFCSVFFGSLQYYNSLKREEDKIERLGASMLGASVACLVSQPFDCIKTQKQKAGNSGKSVVGIAKDLGWKGLWKGLHWRTLTSSVGMGVGFYVYNAVLRSI